MDIEQKQAMHVEPGKSFGSAEANENERRWDNQKIDTKNLVSTNHYDKTRMHLNFEIGEDRKVHPIGYHKQNLDKRLEKRLTKLGWHPFKKDSKIQPNCCAKFIFGGDHDRTLEMAFGVQKVNLEKGSDNSHLQRCQEIENWALDVYSWCAKRYGQENIIGFQVHLDETSPHIHALIVPVGVRSKSGRECVMWSAKFGKNVFEYGKILREMHTSLYQEVGIKYGLERGDSVLGRNINHLNKVDYIRQLEKKIIQEEKAVKGLETMIQNLKHKQAEIMRELQDTYDTVCENKELSQRYSQKQTELQKSLADIQIKLNEKEAKLHEKESELASLSEKVNAAYSIKKPFKSFKTSYTVPRITTKPPMFGVEDWVNKQNSMIKKSVDTLVDQLEQLYKDEAQKQIEDAQKYMLSDYSELGQLRIANRELAEQNQELGSQLETLLEQITIPKIRRVVFALADSLITGEINSSSGGGDTSDLRWDGKKPGEDDDAFARRCLLLASQMEKRNRKSNNRGVHR